MNSNEFAVSKYFNSYEEIHHGSLKVPIEIRMAPKMKLLSIISPSVSRM